MNQIQTRLLAALAIASVLMPMQGQKPELRDYKVMTKPQVVSWAKSAKLWVDQSTVLMSLIVPNEWKHQSDSELLAGSRKRFKNNLMSLEALQTKLEKLIASPYGLQTVLYVDDGISEQVQFFNYLIDLPHTHVIETGMSEELREQLWKQNLKGYDLENRFINHRYGVIKWYEKAAGTPVW